MIIIELIKLGQWKMLNLINQGFSTAQRNQRLWVSLEGSEVRHFILLALNCLTYPQYISHSNEKQKIIGLRSNKVEA